jgi:hypothetical protein
MYFKIGIQRMFLCVVIDDNHLLKCNAVYAGRYVPTFKRKLPSLY